MSEPASRPGEPARPRIGDAERDQAVGYLQEHMAQGRLDRDEFDERLSQALTARTEADLTPLFDDLPEPRPSRAVVPVAPPTGWRADTPSAAVEPAAEAEVETFTPRWVTLVLGAIWPLAFILNFATDWNAWWAWVVAGLATGYLRHNFANQPRPPDRPSIGR